MIRLRVENKDQQTEHDHDKGPIELGRGPARDGIARLEIDDSYVSRDHVRIEQISPDRVRIQNLSTNNRIGLPDGNSLAGAEVKELNLPTRLKLGQSWIAIQAGKVSGDTSDLQTIALPFRMSHLTQAHPSLQGLSNLMRPDRVTQLLSVLIDVQRAAAGSPEFYKETADAAFLLVGLDRVSVLLRKASSWKVVAQAGKPAIGRGYSDTILDQVLENKRTYFRSLTQAQGFELSASLTESESVVASPIFGAQDQIVGAIYGTRTLSTVRNEQGISDMEAQVLQLLATAVGLGLARLKQEQEAHRLRFQFEQFFSRSLAEELERDPKLLEGQVRDITVMFCDIRGFSRISEKLTPLETCRLVGEVMEIVTDCVRKHEGVVVDYMGDGLMAMWNAPKDQPEHAVLACRAVLRSKDAMPALSARWVQDTSGPIHLGFGINTGPALVGNTGTQSKFKYGPLGHTVNLASRVEGATKHFRLPILITGSTWELVKARFSTRRIGKAILLGMQQPADLYELHAENLPGNVSMQPETWMREREHYERALAHFEKRDFVACCQAIYPVLSAGQGNYDMAALELSSRALEQLKQPTPADQFEPVFRLESK